MGAEIWSVILAGVVLLIGVVFRAGGKSATNRARAQAAEAEQQATGDARRAEAAAGRAGAKARLDEGTF